MTMPRPMPKAHGCNTYISFFGREKVGYHNWTYSGSWNGNNREVLPFLIERTSGLPRSGWFCAQCGTFAWDETDEQFAKAHMKLFYAFHDHLFQQAMGRDMYGRELSFYDDAIYYRGNPFIVHRNDESIVVTCREDTVARWSTGKSENDEYMFGVWIKTTRAVVKEVEEA